MLRLEEFYDSFANFLGRVFLDEMQTFHRYFLLIRPGAAEFALLADEDRPRIGIDEQFGNGARREPFAIVINDGHNISVLLNALAAIPPGP